MMTVKEVFELFGPFGPEILGIDEVTLTIETTNVDDQRVEIQMLASDLYADWNGECNSVPENDAVIHSLTISAKGKSIIMDEKILNGLTFFEAICLIEDVWIYWV